MISKRGYFLLLCWAGAVAGTFYLIKNVDHLFVPNRAFVANLSKFSGKAEIRHEDVVVWSAITEGGGIADNSLLATGVDSSAEVTFLDGRRIRLGELTQVFISVSGDSQSKINTVTLFRGEISTLGAKKVDNPKRVNPLLIRESSGKSFRIDKMAGPVHLKKAGDEGLIKITKAPQSTGSQNDISDIPKPASDLFTLDNGLSFGAGPEANPIGSSSPDSSRSSLSLASPDLPQVPLKIASPIVPRFPRQAVSLPAGRPLLDPRKNLAVVQPDKANPAAPLPLESLRRKIQPPVIDFKENETFCTFEPISDRRGQKYFEVPLVWNPPEMSPAVKQASFALTVLPQSGANSEAQIVKLGLLRPGRSSIPIDVTSMLSEMNDDSTKVTRRLPLRFEARITRVQVGSEEIEIRDTSHKNVSLCSINPITDQAYTVALDRVIHLESQHGRWFPWSESQRRYKYHMRLESLEVFRRFQSILKSAGSFRITQAEVATGESVLYFVKDERVQGSLFGQMPSGAEIRLLRRVLGSDVVIASKGGEFVSLGRQSPLKMFTIDKTLRANDKIYLIVKGRLVSVTRDEIDDNSGLVRSHLQSTWGVFTAPPRLLR